MSAVHILGNQNCLAALRIELLALSSLKVVAFRLLLRPFVFALVFGLVKVFIFETVLHFLDVDRNLGHIDHREPSFDLWPVFVELDV